MDGIRRKILVINSDENAAPSFVLIDLNEVKCCSVRKQYGTIQGGALKKRPLEQYLQSMVLHFELENDKPPRGCAAVRLPPQSCFGDQGAGRKSKALGNGYFQDADAFEEKGVMESSLFYNERHAKG